MDEKSLSCSACCIHSMRRMSLFRYLEQLETRPSPPPHTASVSLQDFALPRIRVALFSPRREQDPADPAERDPADPGTVRAEPGLGRRRSERRQVRERIGRAREERRQVGRVLSRAGVDPPTHVVHLDEQAVAQLLDLLERRTRLGPFLLRRLDQRKDGAELRVDRGILRVERPVRLSDVGMRQRRASEKDRGQRSQASDRTDTHICPPNLYASDCCSLGGGWVAGVRLATSRTRADMTSIRRLKSSIDSIILVCELERRVCGTHLN